jgi:hypothetical protein
MVLSAWAIADERAAAHAIARARDAANFSLYFPPIFSSFPSGIVG